MGGAFPRYLRASAALDVAVLAGVALALRIPFRSGLLWAWDSVLYARATEDFHLGSAVLEQRPHPPGYVLYVLAARASAAVLGDANAGLVAVSVAGAILAVACAYVLGRLLAGRIGGLAAAAIVIAEPLLWHASEVAYPYALLGGLSGALGLVFWWMRGGAMARIVAASALFGVALGVRQDLLLYLGPLWLFTLRGRGHRGMVTGLFALAAAALIWVVPSAVAAGGLDRYAALVGTQAFYASGADDRERALGRNLLLALNGLWWQLLWLWPLAAAGAWSVARSRPDLGRHLAIWIAPALASFAAFHTGEPAYTLVVAVPLAALAGETVARAAALRIRPIAAVSTAVCAAMVLLLAGTFAAGHGRYSAHAVRRHDAILVRQIDFVRAHYDARDTVILGRANYLHSVRYLPEYRSIYVAPRAEGGSGGRLAPLLSGARIAVLFDDSYPRLRRLATRLRLPDDVDLFVITVGPEQLAELEREGDPFEIELPEPVAERDRPGSRP